MAKSNVNSMQQINYQTFLNFELVHSLHCHRNMKFTGIMKSFIKVNSLLSYALELKILISWINKVDVSK